MTYDELLQKLHAGWEGRVILTAAELGVADALAGEALTAEEAAGKLGADPRATEIFLDAMVALGLAKKADGRYENTAVADEFFAADSPQTRIAGLRHRAHIWQSWAQLTDVVKSGSPATRESERSLEEYHDFVRAMYDYGWERASQLAGTLDLSDVTNMLDLGGGPGSYAIAFCLANQALRATVFDREPALDVAREIVKRHGVESRVSLVAGDFLIDKVGDGYDLVFISHILHSYDEADGRRILQKAFSALDAGGRLLVQDFFLAEDHTSPPDAAVFAINMLVNTESGRSYSWDEVESWLVDVGLVDIKRIETPEQPGLIMARKGR